MLHRSPQTLGQVVDWGLCIGCGACTVACTRNAVQMRHVETEGFRPHFDNDACVSCRECLPVCPGAGIDGNLELGALPKHTAADHDFGPVLEIWEGHASDPTVRQRGSSGGVLSALSLYCLEHGGYDGVVHAGMDPAEPWLNRNFVSRTRDEVLARAGSRYAPSAPCAGLDEVLGRAGQYLFVGKPCDAAAVSELRRRDPRVASSVGAVLTFFCAGTPSVRGTLDLVSSLGVSRASVREIHYRGDGWPGEFRVLGARPEDRKSLSYAESWGKLTSYRPLRCNLCPDGLGRVADVACGDAWDQFGTGDDPGRSLILVRTARGRALLQAAARAGYVTLRPATANNVMRAQPSLLDRRRALFGRLLAFSLLGAPIPSYHGFSLLRSWLRVGLKEQARSLLGTMRRILQRGWHRPRRSLVRQPRPGEAT